MSNKNIQLFFDSGLQLPKEHGFSVIFLCSVLIGLILSFKYPIDYLGLTLSILFVLIVFLSNSSVELFVRTRFRKIHILPIVLILLFAILLLGYNSNLEKDLTFFITAFFFMVWMAVNYFNKGRTTEELVIGSMTLTLFVPLIFFNSINYSYNRSYLFLWVFIIYWLVTGFTAQLILYVQYIRKILSLDDFVFIWLCFLVSLVPFYYFTLTSFTLLDPYSFLVLIEPTIFVLYLYFKKPELPDKPVFKKIGRILSLRLLLYLVLLSIVVYVL